MLLSIPFNVQKELVDAAVLEQVHIPHAQAATPFQTGPVPELARLLREARHPVIIAGYGCIRAGARGEVTRLAEALRIPVATSLKGKGVIAENSELALGCLGVTSNGNAHRYIAGQADLVLFLGAGFNERTSHMWDARLLEGKRVAPRPAGRLPGQGRRPPGGASPGAGDTRSGRPRATRQVRAHGSLLPPSGKAFSG